MAAAEFPKRRAAFPSVRPRSSAKRIVAPRAFANCRAAFLRIVRSESLNPEQGPLVTSMKVFMGSSSGARLCCRAQVSNAHSPTIILKDVSQPTFSDGRRSEPQGSYGRVKGQAAAMKRHAQGEAARFLVVQSSRAAEPDDGIVGISPLLRSRQSLC